jgi:molecular chaperone GrpE
MSETRQRQQAAEQAEEELAQERQEREDGAPAATAPSGKPQARMGESADGEAAELQGDLDELVAKANQRDEYLALAQRTQADFDNYRKRVARDLAAAGERGMATLVKELLPALDNLERALEAAESHDPLLAGVKLVHAELSAALARVGIEQFAPLGEQFDPNEHEAMAQQPVEGVESGKVAEVFQNGYRLKGTVIRPARVLVAA